MFLTSSLAWSPHLSADRRDQVAADKYSEGVRLINNKKYREGAAKISEAIARGATEPNDEQGSEGRFMVRQYDPYYWLGVAQMEMGLNDQALANFEKSESIVPAGRSRPAITEWKKEYADLLRRKKVLLSGLEASIAVPTPRAEALPTQAPRVVVALPTLPPVTPESKPTAIQIRLANASATATPVSSPATASRTPERSGLLALRAEWKVWLDNPELGVSSRVPLAPLVAEIDRLLVQTPAPSSPELVRLTTEIRSRFRASIAPRLRSICLSHSLEALGARQWTDVEKFAELARKADPQAAQPDLLLSALFGTRFVLGGRSDPPQLERARSFYRAWRGKIDPNAPPPRFLSPSLLQLLR